MTLSNCYPQCYNISLKILIYMKRVSQNTKWSWLKIKSVTLLFVSNIKNKKFIHGSRSTLALLRCTELRSSASSQSSNMSSLAQCSAWSQPRLLPPPWYPPQIQQLPVWPGPDPRYLVLTLPDQGLCLPCQDYHRKLNFHPVFYLIQSFLKNNILVL